MAQPVKWRRVYRCQYCRRLLQRRVLERQENRFCELCLHRRLDAQAETSQPVGWREIGSYFAPIRVPKKLPPDVS